MELVIVWAVTAISLLIISRIGLFGVEIENFGTAIVVAAVLGLLNAILRPILSFLSFPLLILTFGLFSIFINAAVFSLAASLVSGFELRRGCFSALVGPIRARCAEHNYSGGRHLSGWNRHEVGQPVPQPAGRTPSQLPFLYANLHPLAEGAMRGGRRNYLPESQDFGTVSKCTPNSRQGLLRSGASLLWGAFGRERSSGGPF